TAVNSSSLLFSSLLFFSAVRCGALRVLRGELILFFSAVRRSEDHGERRPSLLPHIRARDIHHTVAHAVAVALEPELSALEESFELLRRHLLREVMLASDEEESTDGLALLDHDLIAHRVELDHAVPWIGCWIPIGLEKRGERSIRPLPIRDRRHVDELARV